MTYARFELKCRRCAEVYTGACGNKLLVELEITKVACNLPKSQELSPKMTSTHRCKDGGLGVTDLIGCKIVEL